MPDLARLAPVYVNQSGTFATLHKPSPQHPIAKTKRILHDPYWRYLAIFLRSKGLSDFRNMDARPRKADFWRSLEPFCCSVVSHLKPRLPPRWRWSTWQYHGYVRCAWRLLGPAWVSQERVLVLSLLRVKYPLGLLEISVPPQRETSFPGRGRAMARTAVRTLLAIQVIDPRRRTTETRRDGNDIWKIDSRRSIS